MHPLLNRRLTQLFLIAANMLPVNGAAAGRLIFFQVIYLYWLEGFIVIAFDALRITLAQGNTTPSRYALRLPPPADEVTLQFWGRLWLAIKCVLLRCFILAFYGIFLFLFVAFQVNVESHNADVANTLIFGNSYFNLSLLMFLFSATVHFVGRFLIGGEYRLYSPHTYATVLDGRALMLHVMIISVVVIHQHFFDGKSYAEKGEILYVGLFMLVKTLAELFLLNKRPARLEAMD